jgi:aspartokinase/homoserine dehydrogenase 1
MPPPTARPAGPVAHKFGGSSLATPEAIRRVTDILLARGEPRQLIVVSAMHGVTDALIALCALASARDASWREAWHALRQRHLDAAHALLGERRDAACNWLEAQFEELRALLEALAPLGGSSEDSALFVHGLGEVFSAFLLAESLRERGADAAMLDAREVLVVARDEMGVSVDWPASGERFAAWLAAHAAPRAVATGFIARDTQGRASTLGRNGSDYSAAIFAALAGSPELHIWTDVDGVLSADPRLVPEAEVLPALSYSEACELAYFGARVLHPQTMAPAIAHGIPVRIRNTFNPGHPGTLVSEASNLVAPVRGVTAFDGLALVNVEGAGMIGVPGTAERVFGALHRARVSVVMISQGSSEHSICCVVQSADAERAVASLRAAFARELERGQIQRVTAEAGMSVLALVGDGMSGTPGVAARLFGALARASVNVRAISQGASERNISVVVASADGARGLRAIHAGFYLSLQTLSVGLVGAGHVGRALLAQIAAASERLRRDAQLDLRVRAIATSTRMTLDEQRLPLACWHERLERGEPVDLERFASHVRAPHLPHAVLIDCSASDAVAAHYPAWLAAGLHVITPNKHAGGGPWPRYAAIRAAVAQGGRFRYEATVGAGLPVISTLRDLLDTGDEVLAVDGLLSGTLAWLFNRFDGRVPFSALVREARAAGYTEPDPRDDLSGRDVARKLVILAREMGRTLSLEDVEVESLVPEALRAVTLAQFMEQLETLDAPLLARLESARSRGTVLRHVAHLDREGHASVRLAELPPEHAFAHARLTDNVVQFTTRRYRDNPLVVQGPGAGPEVTAAGVFADLLRIASGLGAKL